MPDNIWKKSDEGGGKAEVAVSCPLCSDVIEIGDDFVYLENNRTGELISITENLPTETEEELEKAKNEIIDKINGKDLTKYFRHCQEVFSFDQSGH